MHPNHPPPNFAESEQKKEGRKQTVDTTEGQAEQHMDVKGGEYAYKLLQSEDRDVAFLLHHSTAPLA